MRLATLRIGKDEEACFVTDQGFVPIAAVNTALDTDWPEGILPLIGKGTLDVLNTWYRDEGKEKLDQMVEQAISANKAVLAPLYRRPRKIWGIGLNYVEHAADLSEVAPTTAPASFMKPDTTIIGYGDSIEIPLQSSRTTAEAELGVVIGRLSKNVEQEDWLRSVAGFTTIIDVTAEDILRQNPRYLTMSKSFDTFFSFGPQLVTPDEIEDPFNLRVSTVINGRVHAENVVSNMTFPPDYLVSFHSRVMTLLPGDIISTGTPGAVPIKDGDTIECRITGLAALTNSVRDLSMQH
ncbi:MAG: fumarylacetoacetate hydrolase [Gemmatimonadales bacterium]|nr:fumarylacetoacetate hydrolase [Gemmatimonadales bacterium]